jgi:hypothetical protein
VIKDDHMPIDSETRRSPWWTSVLFGMLSLPLLYILGFGPGVRIASLNPDVSDSRVEWPEPSVIAETSEDSDELQNFIGGPEFKLLRQVQAIEEYKRRQQEQLGNEGQEARGSTGIDDDPLGKWLYSPEARAINRHLGVSN